MAAHGISDYDVILGKMICDRMGLDPHSVAREGFVHELVTPGTVMVRATVMHTIPVTEMRELEAIAHARYMAGLARD